MPMLDASDWLLLATVLTTGGWNAFIASLSITFLLGFFRITLDTANVHDQSAVTSHGHCCVNLCVLLLVTLNFIIFELSFFGMSCVETYDKNMARACWP
jgi:membrane-anchored glycerophosphoryl diester phosphodiesterase (GDPDase)